MKKILFICCSLFFLNVHAQVGINTTTPNAQLEIKSSDASNPANTDGILIPKVDVFPATNPTADQDGMLVYLTTDIGANLKGFYYWDNTNSVWKSISGDKGWSLTGNAGTDVTTHFIGTTDFQDVVFKRFNFKAGLLGATNTSFGSVSLFNDPTGIRNSAFGVGSLHLNSIGNENTGVGFNALAFNSTGNFNTSVGALSLNLNTTGSENTAAGAYALHSNTTANYNAAFGTNALRFNKTGEENTALGAYALMNNSGGFENTAIGTSALRANLMGQYNVAVGKRALFSSTIGEGNTAIGYHSLYSNEGNYNVAIGSSALRNCTYGNGNVAVGREALFYSTGYGNVALGDRALYYLESNSSANVCIGDWSGAGLRTGISNTCIGGSCGGLVSSANSSNFSCFGYNSGEVGGNSNTIELGNTSVSWIGGQVGFFNYSDGRIKKNVQDNVPGLSFITKLRPVTYHFDLHKQNEMVYKDQKQETWEGKYDLEKELQTGFIAQEVEETARKIGFEFNGIRAPKHDKDLYSVQYASFVVPLVKAVQEQQEIIENQGIKIQLLEDRLKALEEKLSK